MNTSFSMGGFGAIYMIALWVLILFSIYSLIRIFILPTGSRENKKSLIDILKRRYVNGEIKTSEYKQMKNIISDDQE